MGNDVSKAIRGRLEALAEKASAAGTRVLSTAKAAKLALTYPGGTGADGVIAAAAVASSSSLSGNFFAACGLRSFSPADMRNFALVANEYIEHRRRALALSRGSGNVIRNDAHVVPPCCTGLVFNPNDQQQR